MAFAAGRTPRDLADSSYRSGSGFRKRQRLTFDYRAVPRRPTPGSADDRQHGHDVVGALIAALVAAAAEMPGGVEERPEPSTCRGDLWCAGDLGFSQA